MNKLYYKVLLGVAALPLVMAGHAMTSKGTVKQAPQDTVKVEKEEVVPEEAVIDEVIWVVGDELS